MSEKSDRDEFSSRNRLGIDHIKFDHRPELSHACIIPKHGLRAQNQCFVVLSASERDWAKVMIATSASMSTTTGWFLQGQVPPDDHLTRFTIPQGSFQVGRRPDVNLSLP